MWILLFLVMILPAPLLAESHGLSEPIYEGKVKIVYPRVTMRDGVELATKITMPDAEGRFPAVMMYHPYRGVTEPKPDYRDERPMLVPYLAERGYAIVQYDVRGTGNSGGWSKDIYSDDERRDGYEMVEWIARQPWSNENVGMTGISYGGVVQWQVAVQNPPSLKTIIVRSANDSVYTEWTYPGGSLRPYMFDTYSPLMTAYNFAPPDPEIVGEKWSDIWQTRLENNQPWGIGYISHQQEGPYWQDRSLSADYSRVKCPVFVIAGWADVYPTALLRAFSKLDVKHKKALVGPWRHIWAENEKAVPGPRIDGRPIMLKWFDYWLKGIDNGVLDEPPVTVFVREYDPPSPVMPIEEPGFWRSELEWPIAREQPTKMYFHPDGKLSRTTPEGSDGEGDRLTYKPTVGITSGIHWGGGILPWGNPIDQRADEAYSLTYTTAPLEEPLEVSGTPRAMLYASSTAEVAYFRVKLIDVAPDGTSKLVRYGGMNAAHRKSHFEPEPLRPGEVHEVPVEVKVMTYVFAPGHRVRVAIANADIQNAWPTALPAENTVYRNRRYPSHIVLPVIPEQNPKLPEPDFVTLPNADPKVALDQTRPLEYSITQDLVAETTTVRLGKERKGKRGDGEQYMKLLSSFTVSEKNPANAALKAAATLSITRPESEVKIEANELTSSNKAAFRHLVEIEITVNGRRHFNRSWSVTIPRKLN